MFGTEQENSSEYFSIDVESEHEKNWSDMVKVVLTGNLSRTLDALLWLCEGLYYVLINILLVPVAILGLIFDKLRHILRKVSDEVALLIAVPIEAQNKETASGRVSQNVARVRSKEEDSTANRVRYGPYPGVLHQGATRETLLQGRPRLRGRLRK